MFKEYCTIATFFFHEQQKMKNDEEVVENFEKFEIKRIYWDNDGNLRHGMCLCLIPF